MKKVLVSPSSFGKCGDEPLEKLKSKGYQIIHNPYGRKLTADEVVDLAGEMDGAVAGVESYSKKVIDQLPALKCISRVGVGVDSIDLEYCNDKNIKVIITPEGPTQAVAELSIGLAFNLLRRISLSDRRIRNGIWKKEIGNLLTGKKVGIIGLGRIGRRVSKLYKFFKCDVHAYDLYPDKDWMRENDITYSSMDQLLSESDIISLHVPPSSDSKPILGKFEIAKLNSEIILINLARGGVVDEEHLFNFLQNNSQAFAALDVFEKEPYSGKFKDLDNVVLTPHLGSYAKESKLQMELDAVDNLINYFEMEERK